MKTAIFCRLGEDNPELKVVFTPHLKARIKAKAPLFPSIVTPENFVEFAPFLSDLEVIFATWGMWNLSLSQLELLPNLKAVFYAAGTVGYFAPPLLERGVVVTSAWAANAIPVAEFALGQILLANKGFFRNVREFGARADYGVFRGRGNYGATVSILGAGQIGRKLIELLRPFHLRVLCFDPFLNHKAAELLGVEWVETLDEAFSRGDIVSNHLANVSETRALLCGHHFALLLQNATFINTGRGATVNHDDLLDVLQARPDVTALLDVTDPQEPLPLSHPLRALPNAIVSGHIAGSIGEEVGRMGDFAFEEFERWQRGEPLRYAVTPQMLETMA